MTTSEFSAEFDLLYNNIGSASAPGLTEYEKSVFLTKGQDDIIKSYFNPAYNKAQEGFDSSQKRQYDFSTLVRVSELYNINKYKERITALEKIDKRSQVFLFPEDYFLSINEVISDCRNMYSVIPISYEEYQRLLLKPYALPVKKGAWRLFTDKKNCNYFHEYIKYPQVDNEGNDPEYSSCDYKILSTWADQKRTMIITIKAVHESNVSKDFLFEENALQFDYHGNGVIIVADAGYSDDRFTYEVGLTVSFDITKVGNDDETLFKVLKHGFNLLLQNDNSGRRYVDYDYDISKAATHLDGMIQATAPSKFNDCFSETGKTFTTKCIALPIAEIIGKFTGPITYQLRYIKRPNPIILTDIDEEGLSIRGFDKRTECELSSEIHSEILQRAVELAKAAYAGDLTTVLTVGNASATEKGMVSASKN